jgi:hypothetical protein
MKFDIEIINVQSITKPTAKGSYTMLDVAFRRVDTGKIEGKKVMSFTYKEVFTALSKAQQGQKFTITTEKNAETTYWDWVAVDEGSGTTAATPDAAPAKAGFASPKSTYETADERAARQVLIVRQSSLSNAIETVTSNSKTKADLEEILKVADTYCNWVFQKGVKLDAFEPNFADMDDDIPM